MIINYFRDKNNKKLLLEIEQLFHGFSIKYNTGNFQKKIVHYLDNKCSGANINVFYVYINLFLNFVFLLQKCVYRRR